jgi:hypothetical protein
MNPSTVPVRTRLTRPEDVSLAIDGKRCRVKIAPLSERVYDMFRRYFPAAG